MFEFLRLVKLPEIDRFERKGRLLFIYLGQLCDDYMWKNIHILIGPKRVIFRDLISETVKS